MPAQKPQQKFGETVKIIRMKRDLTQATAAERAGVSPSYWALIEQGKRRPGMDVVDRIAEVLRVPATVLVFLSSDLDQMEKLDKDIAERLALLSLKLIESEAEVKPESEDG